MSKAKMSVATSALKFRGKTLTGEWAFGGSVDWQRDTPHLIEQGTRQAVDASTLCQFTGFTVDGVEVYGRDIVMTSHTVPEGQIEVLSAVYFCPEYLQWMMVDEFGQKDPLHEFTDLKVVGNAIDHPDLMGEVEC